MGSHPAGRHYLANPTLTQIFHQHNEHRIFTTKVLTLLLYHIDGWNSTTHQGINFIIYGFLVFFLGFVIKKCVPQLSGWVLIAFIVFLFSTVDWENHFWAFQTQFHFSLLFLLISIWFLFNESQTWQKILIGVFFSWLSIYSLSSGLVESVFVLLGYSCFKLIRYCQHPEKQKELSQFAVSFVLIGGAIALYFVGYINPQFHPPFAFPYQKVFWVYFFNLLSGGFGYVSHTLLPGFVIFLFLLIPIVGEIWKKRLNLPVKSWIIIISIIADFRRFEFYYDGTRKFWSRSVKIIPLR